jgi:hypothetical protein
MKNKIKIHAIALFFGGLFIQFYQVFWGQNVVDLLLGFCMVLIAVANFYTLDLLNFGTILKSSRQVKYAFIKKYQLFNWSILISISLLYLLHLNLLESFQQDMVKSMTSVLSIGVISFGLIFMVRQNVNFLRSKLELLK